MLILELAALFALLSIVVALILLVRPEAGQQHTQRVQQPAGEQLGFEVE